MKIQNAEKLAQTPLRKAALEILEAGLQAIDTYQAIKKGVRMEGNRLVVANHAYDIQGKIYAAAIGKSATQAAFALEEALEDALYAGFVFDAHEYAEYPLKKSELHVGTHPMPSDKNAEISKRLVVFLEQATEQDVVLFVISGGGSALLCLPQENMQCATEATILKALFSAGAPIQEINTVRKHLSFARGGFLAQYAYPARAVSLIFSDIPGNDISLVASGPTAKDATTIADAKTILRAYNIQESQLIETPKDQKYFDRVENILFLSNDTALQAMAKKAKELGFNAHIQTNQLTGEARDKGREIAQAISKAPPRTAYLYGGETTVTMKNGGKGGRNQELALASLELMQTETLLASLNSDGWDNTDHAGALCDILTKENAERLKLDPAAFLQKHASYDFFDCVEDYILTRHTGSNVSDLILAMKE
ncbi:MAG: DUF4147 domain-containing protein [Candidatus Wildermuthbacteria bacterium]|nr:DUF4147 domain-containing protein [Candidatus Wildermuthbacteria bacterium]